MRRIHHIHFFACIGLILLVFTKVNAQLQPLSRNDNAQIEKELSEYERAKNNGNRMEASRHLNDVAFIYWEHNNYESAIKYYEQSLALNQELGNENGIAMLHNNLGMLYSDIGEYNKAVSFFEKTLAARRAFKNKEGIISALKNMSIALNNLGQYDRAAELLQEALTTARETNDLDQIISCYLYLSETYEKAGDVSNTKRYFELYQTYYEKVKDSDLKRLQQLADEEAILKEIAEIQSQKQKEDLEKLNAQLSSATKDLSEFSAEKQKLAEDLSNTQLRVKFLETESENERLINEEKMRRARAFRNLLLLGALSLLLVSFFIYRNYKHEQKSKRTLAAKNEQINQQNEELESLNKIIAKHNERMQSELNVGHEIQMSMIPSEFPVMKGIDLYATIVPALEVGGDLYDFFSLDDDHIFFGVGDVSDKGVPAALFMAVTKTLVKTNSNYSMLPSKILSRVNHELSQDNDSSMFVTYFLCVLNTKTGELAYCNAGHNPPLYVSKNHVLSKLDTLHGPVLGAVEDYEYLQDQLTMNPGDQLVIFTDGVTEAMNIDKQLYSNDRLDQIFSHNGRHGSKDSVQAIIDDVKEFRGEADQSDDITILSIVYTGM